MTNIQQNISLQPYNTFGIDVKAKQFFSYNHPSDIKQLILNGHLTNNTQLLILGGGSNHLFTKDYNGLVLHPVNDTIEIVKQNSDFVWLKADAGLNWDTFVNYTVENSWGGIENLSNIPGCVGAAPVQNIGAYGVEAKDTINEVHVVNITDGSEKIINNADCEFGYRTSIFKTKLKNQYLVDAVTFKLSKKPEYVIHYGSIQDELDKIDTINLKVIRDTIIKIRDSKLPDPKQIGNGGSFFKNPVVDKAKAEELLNTYPTMPIYDAKNDMKKLAAGWLIEQCGLKGYTNQNNSAGIHDKQALVIINKGTATGNDIYLVSQLVQNKVFNKFNIKLEPEVIIL